MKRIHPSYAAELEFIAFASKLDMGGKRSYGP
jgi:hypothetical protein